MSEEVTNAGNDDGASNSVRHARGVELARGLSARVGPRTQQIIEAAGSSVSSPRFRTDLPILRGFDDADEDGRIRRSPEIAMLHTLFRNGFTAVWRPDDEAFGYLG